jgi:homocitrate synthase NifV
MLIITEKLLSLPEMSQYGKEELLAFYNLFLKLGVDLLEVELPVYAKLAGKADRRRLFLRIGAAGQAEKYPGFAGYICSQILQPERRLIWETTVSSSADILRAAAYKGGLRVLLSDEIILHNYAALFHKLLDGRKETLECCPRNHSGCAGARVLEWLKTGGQQIAVSFLGRGGFAPLEEVLLAVCATGGPSEQFKPAVLRELTDLYQTVCRDGIPPHKSVVGEEIFHVESGVHVDGIIKDAANYEPFPPSLVGARRHIRIGRHSGKAAVVLKAREQGVSLQNDEAESLLNLVRKMSLRLGRGLSEEEFAALLREYKKGGAP